MCFFVRLSIWGWCLKWNAMRGFTTRATIHWRDTWYVVFLNLYEKSLPLFACPWYGTVIYCMGQVMNHFYTYIIISTPVLKYLDILICFWKVQGRWVSSPSLKIYFFSVRTGRVQYIKMIVLLKFFEEVFCSIFDSKKFQNVFITNRNLALEYQIFHFEKRNFQALSLVLSNY